MFSTQLKSICGTVLIGVMMIISSPAMATNDAMLDLLKILRNKGSITAEEYELLVNASRADAEKVEGVKQEAAKVAEDAVKELPKIDTKGKLELSHKENTFRIGGRLQGDTTFAAGDANLEGEGGSPVTEFRRARMYLSGVLQKHWKFKFQYDFAGQDGDVPLTDGIRDAYIAYTGFEPVTITFGHHKTPLGLEELTSSKYITFIERSQFVEGIVSDTGGGRQYALSAKGYFADMFTLAGAIYAGSADEDTAEDLAGFTSRLTFSPIHEKTRMVHFGLGFDRAEAPNGGIDIDAEPEIHPGADIAETDSDDHEESTTWVAELAGIYGPFSLQAEYAHANVEDSPTERDVDADGWYVYGSYYLTGESRNYDWKGGAFKQTKVKNPLNEGGMGAWEVALRYANGDFENADVLDTGFDTDEADVLTAGLNWYPTNNVRFSANYVTVLDSSAGADAEHSPELDTGATADDADYFVLRGQWYF